MPEKNEPTVGTVEKEPIPEVETIAKSELEALKVKAKKHDEDGFKGRKLEERETAVKEGEARIAQERKGREEAELEAARDDTDALKGIRARHTLEDKKAELAERERVVKESEEGNKASLEQIKVFNRTKLAAEVAVAKGVSMDSILKHAKDDSREAMEAVADDLPKKDDKPPLVLDSGKGIGGGERTAEQKLKARYPTM